MLLPGPMLSKLDLAGLILSVLAIGITAAFILGCAAFATFRFFGHSVQFGRVSFLPLSIKDIEHRKGGKEGPLVTTIGALTIRFHLPSSTAPYWLTATVEHLTTRQDHRFWAKCPLVKVTMWLLPRFFRFTAGPLVTAEIDNFIVDVVESGHEPWFLHDVRINLVQTMLRGEITRVHDVKTKVWLWEPSTKPSQTAVQKAEDEGWDKLEEPEQDGEDDDPSTFIDAEVEREEDPGNPERRLRVSAFEVFVHNKENGRMYTLGRIDTAIKRPWRAPPLSDAAQVEETWPGTLMIKMHNCKWIKLPRVEDRPALHRAAMQILRDMISWLLVLLKGMYCDPLQFVDLAVGGTEMNYRQFHFHDAEIFIEVSKHIHRRYTEAQPAAQKALQEFAWQLWRDAINTVFAGEAVP